MSIPQANLQLSWLRVFIYQCELSWSLLKDPADRVDTPLRSPKGKLPGWSVYLFMVTICHGDLDIDLLSLGAVKPTFVKVRASNLF